MQHHLQFRNLLLCYFMYYFDIILYHLQKIETLEWISTLNNHQTLTHMSLHFFQPMLPVIAGHQEQPHGVVLDESPLPD